MNFSKKYELGMQFILTLLGTYGVCYVASLASKQPIAFSVVSIFVAITIFMLLSQTKANFDKSLCKNKLKRRIFYAMCISILFALTTIAGYQLQNYSMTDAGVKGKGFMILRAFCLAIAVFPFTNYFFYKIEDIDFSEKNRK